MKTGLCKARFLFITCTPASTPEQKTWLPAHALGRCAEFFEGAVLNLTYAFFADTEQMADLAQAVRAVAGQAKAEVEDLALAGSEVFHQVAEGLLTLGIRA